MTKAEAYDKAWRPGRKDDFSLVDEIYHQNYKSIDCRIGIEANIEDDKAIVSTLGESVVLDLLEHFLREKILFVLKDLQNVSSV